MLSYQKLEKNKKINKLKKIKNERNGDSTFFAACAKIAHFCYSRRYSAYFGARAEIAPFSELAPRSRVHCCLRR